MPKDSKQLLANFDGVPQNIISAVVEANRTRKEFVAAKILDDKPKKVGIYRLTMKSESDNFRESAIHSIIVTLSNAGVKCLIYEPILTTRDYFGCEVVNNLDELKQQCDIILANRWNDELVDVKDKVYTRDLFKRD